MQNSEKEFNPCDLCSPHEGCDNCRLGSLEEEIKKLNSQVEILSTDPTQQEWDLLTEAHVSAVERADKAQAALEEMEKENEDSQKALGGHYRPGETVATTVKRLREFLDTVHLERDKAQTTIAEMEKGCEKTLGLLRRFAKES